MSFAYKGKTRKRLLKLFEARAPKYGRTSKTRQHAKAQALLRRPVPLESLPAVTKPLTAVPYAVIGGHAVTLHGNPRTTEDIDLLVRLEDVDSAVQALKGRGRRPLTIGGCSLRVKGVEVDIVAPDQPWVGPAIEGAVRTPWGRVIAKPYLIVMKLWAMRGEQDDTDAISLLRLMDEAQRRAARKLVERYLPAALEDFDSMVRIAEM